jgi:hypothetical protein
MAAMSEQTFQIGEIAIYVGPFEPWRGQHVTILSDATLHDDLTDLTTDEDVAEIVYKIYVPEPGALYAETFAAPNELRKLPPKDDGRKIVSWSDKEMPWRPKGIKEIR